jgi:hypothetical protein
MGGRGGVVLAPLRPGYTFLVLPLCAGPILALTLILRNYFYIHVRLHTCDKAKWPSPNA